jgi:iron complex outermembrane receptor protein
MTRALRGRQTLRAGVEVIGNMTQDLLSQYIGDPVPFLETDRSSIQQAAYVQDEIKLGRWVILNGGLRYDRYEAFVRVTPRAALIVLPSSTQSFKYLYGSAFRAPNENELNTVYFGERVTSLRPETINTHEVVWERYVNDRLRTSVSTYWYAADRLITPALDDSTLLGVSFVNQGQVHAKGFELEGQMRLKGDSTAVVSYALQSAIDQQTGDKLPNSPRHIAKARISLPGPTRGSFVSMEGQYLSSRNTIAGPPLRQKATMNVHVLQPLGPSWQLFGGVQNVFGSAYLDPVSENHLQDAIAQNGRTARIGIRWSLWEP